MAKLEVKLDARQVEQLVKQLRADDRRRLIQRLAEQDADRVLLKVRRHIRALGLTPRDLARIVDDVRHGRNGRRRR